MLSRNRNTGIWKDYTDFTYRGISNNLKSDESTVNVLGRSFIESGISIIDDKNSIRFDQLEDMVNLGYDQIANEEKIVDLNAITKRSIMALKLATNDYIMAVVKYATEVKSQIEDARILAIEMSQNRVVLAENKATLADEKADIEIQEIDLKIELENIERKHVEIEKLKAKLSVAKANTQLIMAEIDVKKAELSVINGRVQKVMSEVDKINLTVDVAGALADIMVRRIAGVRLGSERADLSAMAEVIAIKLSSMLSVIDERMRNVLEKTVDETELLSSLEGLQVAKLDDQQTQIEEAESADVIQIYKKEENEKFLGELRHAEKILTELAIRLIDQNTDGNIETDKQRLEDNRLTLKAQAEGYRRKETKTRITAKTEQTVKKG